ncbi:hypothetical protein [Nocardioides jensenii]|uniref:hypothetical protein n=1 Tax=Nocardioides jensenii TaxID=1843 RepID=UPI00082C5790|nr:hypothetical protein [Nocardioides jensenii]
MSMNLSRLEHIKVRDVWAHEAHDFTQWMLENADVLSDVLGMQLELTAAEHKVGGFALDLIERISPPIRSSSSRTSWSKPTTVTLASF